MEESAQGFRMMISGEPIVSLDTLPVVTTKNLKVNESFWPAVSERYPFQGSANLNSPELPEKAGMGNWIVSELVESVGGTWLSLVRME